MDRKALVPLALLLAAAARAEDLKAIAQAKLDELARANIAKNVAWFEKAKAPDYVYIDEKGRKQSRAAEMAEMKDTFSYYTVKTCRFKLVSLKRTKDGMVAIVDSVTTGVSTDPVPHKPLRIEGVGRDEIVWGQGPWRIHRQRAIRGTMKVDGKVVGG